MAYRRKITSAPKETRDLPIKNIFTGNLADLKNRLMSTTTDEYLKDQIAGTRSKDRQQWAGIPTGSTFEETVNYIETGSPEILKQLSKTAQELKPRPQDINRSYLPDTEGLFFDIPTMLSGQPEHWLNEEQEPAARFADIEIGITAPNTITEGHYFKKLVQAAALIDQLESSGTRCNIWLSVKVDKTRKSTVKSGYYFKLQIKKESEPANLQQLATLVCTPIIMRFAVFILEAEVNGHYYGENFAEAETERPEMTDTNKIYIPSFMFDHWQKNDQYTFSQPLTAIYPHLKNLIEEPAY